MLLCSLPQNQPGFHPGKLALYVIFFEEPKDAKTLQLLNNSVKNDNAHITEMEQKSLCASQEYPEAFLCAEFCYPMLILQMTSHTVINKCSKKGIFGF